MPLVYDDIPGSWGTYSQTWPMFSNLDPNRYDFQCKCGATIDKRASFYGFKSCQNCGRSYNVSKMLNQPDPVFSYCVKNFKYGSYVRMPEGIRVETYEQLKQLRKEFSSG